MRIVLASLFGSLTGRGLARTCPFNNRRHRNLEPFRLRPDPATRLCDFLVLLLLERILGNDGIGGAPMGLSNIRFVPQHRRQRTRAPDTPFASSRSMPISRPGLWATTVTVER